MTELDLDRIQGFVVRGYRLPLARYIFLRIDDPVARRRWIAEIAGDVLTAAPWSAEARLGLNIAFSYAGLAALAAPRASRWRAFPEEFRDGMAARAICSATQDASAPANWEAPLGTPDVHVLVMISAAHQQALERPRSAHPRRASSAPAG